MRYSKFHQHRQVFSEFQQGAPGSVEPVWEGILKSSRKKERKMSRASKTILTFLFLLVVIIDSGAEFALADYEYTITDPGRLPGMNESEARGIFDKHDFLR